MASNDKVYYRSPIGFLELVGSADRLKSVRFVDTADPAVGQADLSPLLAVCWAQLDEYFRGERQVFELNLAPDGSEFQQRVWRQLTTIPYGQTVSYLDIACALGDEKTIRAVGAANGQNKIAIIIPCHRVIGRDGKLVGYGGGLWRKAWLLNHERKFSSGQLALF